ncbi:MAG TPA: thioredoxin family protein [Spirochaetota bacterium]|nr:thioredoxin family protein [Spirochaetota bacterium]
MRLEILSTGCLRCIKLEEFTRKAASKLGIDAKITKVPRKA